MDESELSSSDEYFCPFALIMIRTMDSIRRYSLQIRWILDELRVFSATKYIQIDQNLISNSNFFSWIIPEANEAIASGRRDQGAVEGGPQRSPIVRFLIYSLRVPKCMISHCLVASNLLDCLMGSQMI